MQSQLSQPHIVLRCTACVYPFPFTVVVPLSLVRMSAGNLSSCHQVSFARRAIVPCIDALSSADPWPLYSARRHRNFVLHHTINNHKSSTDCEAVHYSIFFCLIILVLLHGPRFRLCKFRLFCLQIRDTALEKLPNLAAAGLLEESATGASEILPAPALTK